MCSWSSDAKSYEGRLAVILVQEHNVAIQACLGNMMRCWKKKAAGLVLIVTILAFIFSLSSPLSVLSNGSAWTEMSSGTSNALRGVWGNSSSDVFAVGDSGTILRYDSSAWTEMSSGTTIALQGVWSSSSSDVFAVGEYGTILHYDGIAWSSMVSSTASDLYGIWGSSSSDVFAVGNHGTILRYDGIVWSPMTSWTSNDLRGIWGNSTSDVFAVGGHGTILHYDGIAWSSMVSSTSNWLHSVWGSSSSDVFAVGDHSTILSYDGIVWSSMSSSTPASLRGVWGSSSSDVFAVGENVTILHYDGIAWSYMVSGAIHDLKGLWGHSSFDVFAVGTSGKVLHHLVQAPPTITSVNPNQGNQGETLDISISGTNLTGASAVSFGGGITINNFTVDNSTQITANITIPADATVGARDIWVTTPGGTGTLADRFTVKAKAENGEVGSCACASVSGGVSVGELLIGWVIVGLCCGSGVYLIKKATKRKGK